jgi:hypothetical protein
MATNKEIIVAKEIKINLILILIGAALTLGFYVIYFISSKPPVNAPVPESVKARIREGISSGNPVAFGSAFSNNSKYDWGLSTYHILNDEINKIRMNHFRSDIQDKTKTAALVIIIGLIGGRYLIKIINWVISTSEIDVQK